MASMVLKRLGSGRENRIAGWADILLNVFFIFYAFLCLYPMLLVLGISFTDNDTLREGYRMIPREFSLEGYIYAFSAGASIVRAYGVSIFVTIVGTVGHVAVCAMFAYPMSRTEFRCKKFFMGFLLIPFLFGGGLVPWYVICVQVLNLRNSIWALILPSMVSIWNILVLRTFFKVNIHPALLESARIDGCGEINAFLKIVIPLSKAGLATVGFFTALGYWNDYWLSLMLITEESLYSLQYLLYNIMARITFLNSLAARTMDLRGSVSVPQETVRMAMCILSVGPIVLAYPYFQRFIVKGITLGSIKG